MHTRGRLYESWKRAYAGGTTHAHAGQTQGVVPVTLGNRNHPCTRGADGSLPFRACVVVEPPMHTRGRQHWAPVRDRSDGTTHAHAGQTRSFLGDSDMKWNHPCTHGADC